MISGEKLSIIAYFEGVQIPITSVSVSNTIGIPAVATISIPYAQGMDDLLVTTHVVVFFAYINDSNAKSPAIDKYMLLFHGEVTAVRMQRNAASMAWQVYAVDSRSYLNRMPSQFTWYLAPDSVHNYVDDYNYFGLPVDKNDTGVLRWYKDNVLSPLMVSMPKGKKGEGKTKSFLKLVRGMSDKHKGEDFIPEVFGEECSYYSPWDGRVLKMNQDKNSRGGYTVIIERPNPVETWGDGGENTWDTERIMLCHLSRFGNIKEGYKVGRGQWLGDMGDTGGPDVTGRHLHIEWTHGTKGKYGPHTPIIGQNGKYTLKGKDLIGRLIGYPGYGTTYMGTGDYSVIEPMMAIGGGPAGETKSYTLEKYVGGLLDLLSSCSGYHSYYRNANTRFGIKQNHVIQDYANNFDILWGTDYYVSFIGGNYRSLSKYRYSTADSMYRSLGSIGYTSLSTSSPKYDEKNNRLIEYITTMDMTWHKPPYFNYINIEEEDSISYSGRTTPITALRWMSVVNGARLSIGDAISPEEAVSPLGNLTMTDAERLYGINRVSEDMDYFLREYIETFQLQYDSPRLFRRTVDYNRMLRSYGNDSVEITKPYLHPWYVVGIPAAVYSPQLEVEYDGVIRSIDLHADTNSGYCSTRVVLQCPCNSDDQHYDGAYREGITPRSQVDVEMGNNLHKFYSDNFYSGDKKEGVVVDGRRIPTEDIPMDSIRRPICTMRHYLEINKHKNIKSLAGIVEVAGIQDFSLSSDHNAPSITLKDNATKTLTIDKMSDMFISERYELAKKLSTEITSKRLLLTI